MQPKSYCDVHGEHRYDGENLQNTYKHKCLKLIPKVIKIHNELTLKYGRLYFFQNSLVTIFA
jgi:hypothetical protein